MNHLLGFVLRLLNGAVRSQVEPVAAALDDERAASALEEGEQIGAARLAAAIRERLAHAYTGGAGFAHEDLAALVAETKKLVSALWGVVVSDMRAAGPAARAWADGALARAIGGP